MKEPKKEKKCRIVVVDDEPIIEMTITEMLTSNGFEVVAVANDGYKAIEVCEQFRPELVLMDINIPQLNGLIAAEYIINNGLADMVIMVTAYCEEEMIKQAVDFGTFGYIIKPIDEKTLISTIEIAIAKEKEISSLKKEITEAQQKVEGRKLIERAKGILMSSKGLSEQDAYNYIRQISKDTHMSMEKVADIVIFGDKK